MALFKQQSRYNLYWGFEKDSQIVMNLVNTTFN